MSLTCHIHCHDNYFPPQPNHDSSGNTYCSCIELCSGCNGLRDLQAQVILLAVLTWLVVRCDPFLPFRRKGHACVDLHRTTPGSRAATCRGRAIEQVDRGAIRRQGGSAPKNRRWYVSSRRRSNNTSCGCRNGDSASVVDGAAGGTVGILRGALPLRGFSHGIHVVWNRSERPFGTKCKRMSVRQRRETKCGRAKRRSCL